MTRPASAYGVSVHQDTTPADIPGPASASCARLGTRPFMTANTPVMVRVVVSSSAQVRRWVSSSVDISGCGVDFSVRQNHTSDAAPMASRMMTMTQLAAASSPAMFSAVRIAAAPITRPTTPFQSIGCNSFDLVSGTPNCTANTAMSAEAPMTQKRERKPKASVSQPPSSASTPAMPPFTEVRMPTRNANCFSSRTACRSITEVSATVGPDTPWTTRPIKSMVTFTDSAAMIEPTTVTAIMPTSTFRRPIRSPHRGINSENSAAAVKNAVCVMPICAVVASSSTSMVASAGDSMDALSWNAKTATSSAVIRGTTWLVGSFCPAAGSEVFVIVMRAV